MRKITLFMALFILIPALHGGQNKVEGIFQKYSGLEGATSIQLSGNLLKMMASLDKDEGLNKIASSISSLLVLHLPKDLVEVHDLDFYREIVPYIQIDNYDEIMRMNKPGQQVIMLARETNGSIAELILIAGGAGDNTLICIKGDLDMNQLSSLSGISVPGMDHFINMHQ